MSWARWIQSTPSHPVSLRSILVLSYHLRLGLRFFPFSCKMSNPICMHFDSASLVPLDLPIIILFYYPITFRRGKNYEDFRDVIFSSLLMLYVMFKNLSQLFPNTFSLCARDRVDSRTVNKSLKVWAENVVYNDAHSVNNTRHREWTH